MNADRFNKKVQALLGDLWYLRDREVFYEDVRTLVRFTLAPGSLTPEGADFTQWDYKQKRGVIYRERIVFYHLGGYA